MASPTRPSNGHARRPAPTAAPADDDLLSAVGDGAEPADDDLEGLDPEDAAGAPGSPRHSGPATARGRQSEPGRGDPLRSVDARSWPGSAALGEERELMGALARAAARAASPAQAAQLISAATPSALRLAPQVQRALWPALPALIQVAADAARQLHQRAGTRPLIAALPRALERAVAQLTYRVARGQPAGADVAADLLTRQVALLADDPADE